MQGPSVNLETKNTPPSGNSNNADRGSRSTPPQERYKAEIFLVGLDVIIDKKRRIKILEVQNVYESNVDRAVELTECNPLKRLIATIKKKYPGIKIDQPAIGDPTDHARKASLIKGFSNIPNRGIEGLCRMKWLFYSICNSHQTLRKYLPKTFIATLASLSDAFDISKLRTEEFLFKPADMAGGNGIMKLPQSLKTNEQLKEYLENKSSLKTVDGRFKTHVPFILQNYHHTNGLSNPVIRIYAAVVVDATGSISTVFVSIDEKAAYQHIRIKQDPNDFTLHNNKHVPCQIADIKDQLQEFLSAFFNTILMGQRRITYRQWEILAKHYIRSYQTMTEGQRLLTISQVAMAINNEQRFTENRLTHYQCFILDAFLECYTKGDAQICANTGLAFLVTNAFAVLAQRNLALYTQEAHYPLHNIINKYLDILQAVPHSSAKQLEPCKAVLKNVKRVVPLKFGRTISPFDCLSKEDLEALSVVSTKQLRMVAGFVHR